jgi:Uma2 family endonuclease
MNAPIRPPETAPARHLFSGEDVMQMQRFGVLIEGGKFELIDGEIIDMPSEGDDHLSLRIAFNRFLIRALPDTIAVATDGTLRLGDLDWPEPDFHLFEASMRPSAVRGPDTLLVVEISDSSLAYDLRGKADLYRRYGVREYWVIDVEKKQLHVHRADGQWPEPARPLTGVIEPSLIPGLAIRLADFLPA